MKAILSCTPDDLYLFNLPFAIHSWNKIGVECIVITTPVWDLKMVKPTLVVIEACDKMQKRMVSISAPPEKAATYAQCARLYAAAIPDIGHAINLITADADMCVFNKDYWGQFEHNGWLNVIGADLVPFGQYPMCYICMPAAGWHPVMEINGRPLQKCLDDLLGDIECDNFRGNYWGKDQETAFQKIAPKEHIIQLHNRAKPGTQFATRRADRDGWPEKVPDDIIDAHLPRPGYLWENLSKIIQLFDTMYPGDNHDWIQRYAEDYIEAMK